MAIVTQARTLRDAPNGNPTGQAPANQKCTVLDQNPAAPSPPLWFKIRLENLPNKPEGWISSAAVNPTKDTIDDGPIDKSAFANQCVTYEQSLGGSSLYVMAVAEMRTRVISPPLPPAPVATTLHGPFALTTADWDFGLELPGVTFQPSDIDSWSAQCDVFSAMAQAAQSKLGSIRAGTPSFVGLYLTQILGANIASSLLDNPNQNINTLLRTASPEDLAQEGVFTPTVLTQYGSILGANNGSAVLSALTSEIQRAIDSVVAFIQQAGGTVTFSSTVPAGRGIPTGPDPAPADRERHAMDFFVNQGWSRQQAAGIVANLEAESRLAPDAVGDGGLARGIAQWHSDRQANFQRFSGRAIIGSSLDQQLSFVQHELTVEGEVPAGNRLRQTTSANDAGAVVSMFYERPRDRDGEAQRRGQRAEQVLRNNP